MIKKCQGCKKDYKTDDKRQRFCNMDCYRESVRRKNTRVCKNCKAKFLGKPKQQCCSRKCSGQLQRKRIKVSCSWCAVQFEKTKRQAERSKDHYCSSECKSKHYEEKFVGSKNPNWRGLTFEAICNNCKDKFTYSDYYGAERFYCSQKCKGEHQSETLLGEKNPNYNKNKSDDARIKERKYPEYHEWRMAVFNRDSFNCLKCGTNTTTDNRLVAHHIINYYSYPEGRTDVTNGITFCSECHWEFHRIYGTMHNNKKQLDEFLK